MTGMRHPTIRARMDVGQLGKASWAKDQCAQDLPLGADLIEERGELFCQDTQGSILGAAQTRPSYSTHWHRCGSGQWLSHAEPVRHCHTLLGRTGRQTAEGLETNRNP